MELSTSAVVLCHSVAVFKRNLAELTFSSFNYVNLKNMPMPLYLFIIGSASLHVMYFTTT